MKAFTAVAFLSLTLLLLAGCGAPADKAPPKDAEGRYVVELTQGNKFNPATATVPQGATIVWKHTGGAPHDVHAEDASFSSGELGGMEEGDEYVHQFNSTGTFPYECRLHSGMTGKIVVE